MYCELWGRRWNDSGNPNNFRNRNDFGHWNSFSHWNDFGNAAVQGADKAVSKAAPKAVIAG